MSEEMPTTSNGIADAITADLGSMGQAEAPPPAVQESPAAAEQATLETATEPEPEQTPTPLKLTDKSIVEDPATGEMKPWGEIKAERLRWKDYTQKTQAAAEMRREAEAMRAQFEAEQAALKARVPEDVLPEDDPYAQRIRANEAQLQAFLVAQQAQQEALEAERYAVADAKLEADVQRVTTEYKLNDQEMDIVGREMLAKVQRGEDVTLDDVAKSFVGYRESLKAAAVKEWQDKHRTSAPAAAVAVPVTGVPADLPAPGSRGFMDAILSEVGLR